MPTEGSKSWYASKGIWGNIGGALATGLGLLGFAIDDTLREAIVGTAEAVAVWVPLIIGFGGNVIGLYGRVKATKKIK